MAIRISSVIKELNVGLQTILDFLSSKGYKMRISLNTKISDEQYELICKEFSSDANLKKKTTKKLLSRSILYDFLDEQKPLDTEDKIDKLFELCYQIHKHISEEIFTDILKNTEISLHSYLGRKKLDYEKSQIKLKIKKKKLANKRKRSVSPYNKDEIVYKRIRIISTAM
ncbi:MAG: hypothetical protein J5770_07555 [Bacteroidaceae bacterium]|nr:hypothetical protein [Bacteroidaceae bacterium]